MFLFKLNLKPEEWSKMKKKGHPPYQDILFVDTATGYKFICGSTLQPKETEMYEGKEFPVFRVPISSASHPFFTGSKQLVDAEGRVDKFKKRYAKSSTPPKEVAKKEEAATALKKAASKNRSGPKKTKSKTPNSSKK